MPTCPNCKKVHGCGCQLATASNGAKVCASCKMTYEADLQKKINSTNPNITTWPLPVSPTK